MATYPFQRILLATEHTEFDVGAERIAFAMAKRCGIPLRVVVPIVSNPEYEAEMPELALRDDRAAGKKIDDLRRDAQAAGVQLEIQVRHGAEPWREIVDEAAGSKADLIVIRRRGKPGFLSNLLVGEMVSKVIRDVSCCVLTVPRAAEFWTHGVLAAVGDTPAAQSIATLAANVASVCDLPLTIVSVAQDPKDLPRIESLNTLNVSLAGAICDKTGGVVAVGQAVEQTVAVCRETGADLLVIGRQRYHLLPFTHGGSSLMQKLAGAMVLPTLVVPS
ncbi:MAG TPA: universal stress protein [Gallionella sp.]|nr:universal stress protein [Gallionella sp.]